MLEKHDQWLIDIWNRYVKKEDIIYILGDFSFANSEYTVKHILPKLKGNKYLILGNHDKSSEKLYGYFRDITQLKEVHFKKKAHPFIEEEEGFRVFMSHYPMLSWNGKPYGVVNLHGHCHGRIDDHNERNTDLRVDVGIDGKLADYNLISLEQVYHYFKEKTGDKSPLEYVTDNRKDEDENLY